MGKKNIVINGKPYQNVSNIKVRDVNGQDLHDFRNTDDATIESKDIPIGKVGYGKDGIVIGTAVQTSGDGEINFYDQYGAWLTSYRLSDLPLSALPEIPALEGAGADQYEFAWTMTLEEVNALTEEADIGVDVTAKEGAKTYIFPNEWGFFTGSQTKTLQFYGGDEASSILIDWGDGSTSTVNVQTNNNGSASHAFSNISHNPISIEKVSGGDFYLGGGGSSRFVSFDRVKEVRIGSSGVKGISQEFLTDNYSVERVILHNTLEIYKGGNANIFDKCYRLKSLNIPKSFKEIGTIIASSCSRLETIFIHDGVESVSAIASQCYSLKKIVFPKTLKQITTSTNPTYLVSYCTSLKNLNLYMDTVSMETGNIIQHCNECKSVVVPEGITALSSNFGYYCYSLETIELPSTLTSIGSGFLSNVSIGVKQIIMKSPTPPTLASALSTYIKQNTEILVPTGSATAYATATNWVGAEHIIEY